MPSSSNPRPLPRVLPSGRRREGAPYPEAARSAKERRSARESSAHSTAEDAFTLISSDSSPTPLGLDVEYCIVGVHYRSAPLSLRERMALLGQDPQGTLARLLDDGPVREAAVVSTCNRVEVVTVVSTGARDRITPLSDTFEVPPEFSAVRAHLVTRLAAASGVGESDILPHLYVRVGRDAVSHAFRVVSGMDSMVLGEPQIAGQVKRAFRHAEQAGAAKYFLSRLFHRAFATSKAVRARTDIGSHPVSVCYAAVEIAAQIFGSLAACRTLVIGTGEMGQLMLRYLHSAGLKDVYVASRSMARASALAEPVQGVALPLERLSEFLPSVNLVIGAGTRTQEEDYLLTREMVQAAVSRRTSGPQLFVDLAIPRNFDPEIERCRDAFVYNIDDLDSVVQANLQSRRSEIPKAELIIEEEVEKFLGWFSRRECDAAIRSVMERSLAAARQEKAKTLRLLRRKGMSQEQLSTLEAALDGFSRALLAKLLHSPFTNLKQAAADDDTALQHFCELFAAPVSTSADTVTLAGVQAFPSLSAAVEKVRTSKRL